MAIEIDKLHEASGPMTTIAPGRLIVISGPSGVGKTTICQALRGRGRIVRSVSATTRAPRPGEAHGRDYFFLKREEFIAKRDAKGFLEWAEYAGNLYGTPKDFVQEQTKDGNFPLLEIEVQGVVQLRQQGWPGIYVFIAPPSIDDLRTRLEKRGNMPPEVIARRIKVAEEELKHRELYDFTVVNDTIDRALAEVLDILDKKLKKE
ncbi:MAG: guanylate [Planctomycetota bacterium]|nr:MAG: guanylate [Planctomycetota bacterium]